MKLESDVCPSLDTEHLVFIKSLTRTRYISGGSIVVALLLTVFHPDELATQHAT